MNNSEKHDELVKQALCILRCEEFTDEQISTEYRFYPSQAKGWMKKQVFIKKLEDRIKRIHGGYMMPPYYNIEEWRHKVLVRKLQRWLVINAVGVREDFKMAIECGNVTDEKLMILRVYFDTVLHIPYTETS